MGWPYHFVDLDDDQKQRRRELLDYYGFVAQVSVILPLVLLQICFLLSRLYRKWENSNELERPSSPYLKRHSINDRFALRKAIVTWRRLVWWSRGPFVIMGWQLYSCGELLLAVLWMAWLIVLCFLQTGDDYLHVTKRFGIVGASQLPFLYMLAMKSPWSPLQILTRCSHETLNSVHQIFGRVLIGFFYLHAICYFNMWVWKGVVAIALAKYFIWFGIAGLVSFSILGTTALSPVRRWSYRVFYAAHISLAAALPLMLWWHVSHIHIYVYEAFAVYIFNAILRQLDSHTLPGIVKTLPNTNLLEIVVDVPRHSRSNLSWRSWRPGQHAYVSLKGNPALRTLSSNPFSVATVPDADRKLAFYARILSGNTVNLARRTPGMDSNFTIEGPYGVTSHAEALLTADQVLMVAGGVGGTFMVPLYRQLLDDLSPSAGSHRRQKVTFVWIARAMSDIMWAVPSSSKERQSFSERLEVHLTRDGQERHTGSRATDVPKPSYSSPPYETEHGIEMEENKQLLSDYAQASSESTDTTALQVTYDRPNLARKVEQIFSHGLTEKVAVVVCGPTSLSDRVREEVGKWVKDGRDIWFWDENFGL